MIAAATENYDNSKDDDPGAVIVKKMAKAVVVHGVFLRCMFAIFGRSFTYYSSGRKSVIDFFERSKTLLLSN